MTINYTILNYHFNERISGIAEGVLSRMDEISEDELYQCMNDELIYTDDQWSIMMEYCTPQNASFDDAWFCFESELLDALGDGVLESEK